MIRKLLSALHVLPPAQACVLLYHRIATPESDVWKIAVEPAHFEQHVRVLKASYRVVSVSELVDSVARGTVKPNSVALTFDDGYADNFLVAKPILDHYGLPATFFIASHYTDQAEEFWWDELEHLILFSAHLPARFSQVIGGQLIDVALGNEACLSSHGRQQQQHWDACAALPPTIRSRLFYQLWELLRPLPIREQQQHLDRIRQWVGAPPSQRPAYRSMSRQQLQTLSASPLHELGLHTMSHPALAAHPLGFQRQELLGNQAFLERATGQKVDLVAYPYGNYNQQTLTLVEQAGLRAAFTTEEKVVTSTSNRYHLGRFQVPNYSAASFTRALHQWLHPS
ncbi:polysaccharide deacetylase family protein [Hymenobacter sp. HD11105]